MRVNAHFKCENSIDCVQAAAWTLTSYGHSGSGCCGWYSLSGRHTSGLPGYHMFHKYVMLVNTSLAMTASELYPISRVRR